MISITLNKSAKCHGTNPLSSIQTIVHKGQLILKANCQAVNSSKTIMNEFVFTTMGHFFVHFLKEIVDTKKEFRNLLTCRSYPNFK